MPSSSPSQLNEIMTLVMLTRPASLLDIGLGFGKYGFLAREYLEYWDGRQPYSERRHRIDGIEAFPNYITPLQRQIYDDIHLGAASTVLPGLSRRYDLALLIDVIEHCTRDDGNRLLDACTAVARNVLVSTPLRMEDQGELFGNSYERHRQQWRKADFRRFPARFVAGHAHSLLVYIGEQAAEVGAQYRKAERRAVILRLAPWLRTMKRLFAPKSAQR